MTKFTGLSLIGCGGSAMIRWLVAGRFFAGWMGLSRCPVKAPPLAKVKISDRSTPAEDL